MNQEYKEQLPLYKQLDSERTQGDFFCDEHEAYIGCGNLMITNVRGSESISIEQDVINAEFLTLASKNLVKLGVALETAEQTLSQLNINGDADNTLRIIREALKDIS